MIEGLTNRGYIYVVSQDYGNVADLGIVEQDVDADHIQYY